MQVSKRVLLFAPYFLPRRRVASMRPFRFAIHLREYGWEPTVLTIATPGENLTPKEASLLRDVQMLTIEAPLDRTGRSESQLGAAAGTRSRRVPDSGLLRAIDRQFPVDTWLLLFAARFRSMVKDVAAVDPHVVWATGDPWSALVVGRWLSERLRVPYVADFRDPWTLSEVRTDGRWAVSQWLDRRSERRIIESADCVLFQAERVEAMYREHYRAVSPRTVTIRNSFDPDVFDDVIELHRLAPGRPSGDLNIGFFGRFRALSPASVVVDVLAQMRARHGDKAGRVFVHSFGTLSAADAEYARRHGVASQFVAQDAVPLQKALAALRAFDVLLVSTETRRRRIIPAKIFDYLPTGRPILSLSGNPEVADILQRTGTGIQMQDPARLADLLSACVDARARGERLPIPFDPKPEEIMRHEAGVSTGELARVLDGLLDHRSSPTL